MTASKILIVEDEDAIREMIVFHLARAGFEVFEAEDCRSTRGLLADKSRILR
jgi:two-component system phosphate regulon response regulator PhoB